MAEVYGYVGKILNVDLTAGTISTIPTRNYAPKFVGGKGIGAKIHWDMVGPNVKGFDPENVITFITSPTTGTPATGGQKTIVAAVSPQMYPVESYYKSMFGGHWGPELKFAGYDGVIVQGMSPKPVYLLIEDAKVELRDAGNLWGLDTFATNQSLWERHSHQYKIAVIGPAGENLVHDSLIITSDSNTAGKGGFGAVMGSKKLKAIVVRGTGEIPVARPQELLDLAYYAQRLVTRKEGGKELSHPWRKSRLGPMSVEGTDMWNAGLNGTARTWLTGCFMCPIDCGFSIKYNDSDIGLNHIMCMMTSTDDAEMKYNNEKWGRAQFERLKLQDRLGFSQSGWHEEIIPLLTEGFVLPESLGIPYEQGSMEFTKELLRKICYREPGFGDTLANGAAKYYNEVLGTPESIYSYQVKAVTTRRSRLCYNYGSYFYGPIGWTGACVAMGRDNDKAWTMANTTTDPRIVPFGSPEYDALQKRIAKELFGSEQAAIDSKERRFGPYTAPMAYYGHNWKIMLDSLGCCTLFSMMNSMYTPEYKGDMSVYRKLFSAVTGVNDMTTAEEEKKYIDRIWMLERAIVTRQGRNKEDDWFFDCIFDMDAYKQMNLTREDLRDAVDHYYELRGIDVATGIPRRSTLEALDLKNVADDLETKYGISLSA